MKTSIIVSTYNGSEYIIEQLESLKKQTKPANEVLIFDDSSTDQTPLLIEQYIKENGLDTWKLVVNEKNIGWRKNFIQGIEKCSGELIFLCDQDDIWNTEKIKKMSEVMECDSHINLLVSTYIEKYKDDYRKEYVFSKESSGKIIKVAIPKNILNVPFPGCVYCVRKSFFQTCRKYWIETCPHDALLWRSAELSGSAYVLNEPLILWRKHETSAWQQEIKTQSVESELKWRKVEKEELEKLLQFLVTDFQPKNNLAIKIVERNIDWCQTRTHWLKERKLIFGIKLLKYIDLYYSYKGYFKDLYLVLFGK